MKKLFLIACIIALSATALAFHPDSLPSRSVRGCNNIAYLSIAYGCAGMFGDEIKMYVELDKPSKGTTIVVVQLTTDDERYTQKVAISDGSSWSSRLTFRVTQGACGTPSIIDAYVE